MAGQQSSSSRSNSSSSWMASGMLAHKWHWRGHSIHYVTAGCGKPVLLVHGFGASCGHYRRTIPWLAKNGFKVGHQWLQARMAASRVRPGWCPAGAPGWLQTRAPQPPRLQPRGHARVWWAPAPGPHAQHAFA
jgi:pimeloyl-ACP methyl ester carboxylesterase